MSEVIEKHIPCPDCGSSDALCTYDDGHSYCFSCLSFHPGQENLTGFSYEYLPHRGIDNTTMRYFDVKTKINSDGKPISMGFKYPNEAYKVRTLEKKGFYTTGDIGNATLFGRDRFNGSPKRTVTITEGELDALSL